MKIHRLLLLGFLLAGCSGADDDAALLGDNPSDRPASVAGLGNNPTGAETPTDSENVGSGNGDNSGAGGASTTSVAGTGTTTAAGGTTSVVTSVGGSSGLGSAGTASLGGSTLPNGALAPTTSTTTGGIVAL